MPTRLFKYLLPKHADALLRTGRVRIGTLQDFRKGEHRGNIGDAGEGSTEFLTGSLDYDGLSLDQRVLFESRLPFLKVNASGFAMEDCEVVHQVRDAYVYCTSLECRKKLWDEYGACVLIQSVAKFRAVLGRTLIGATSLTFVSGGFACTYDRKKVSIWDKAPSLPIRQKPERYRYQAEYRFAWLPKQMQTRELQVVCCEEPELSKYCRVLTRHEHASLAND